MSKVMLIQTQLVSLLNSTDKNMPVVTEIELMRLKVSGLSDRFTNQPKM